MHIYICIHVFVCFIKYIIRTFYLSSSCLVHGFCLKQYMHFFLVLFARRSMSRTYTYIYRGFVMPLVWTNSIFQTKHDRWWLRIYIIHTYIYMHLYMYICICICICIYDIYIYTCVYVYVYVYVYVCKCKCICICIYK